ncbi:MAG: bifunctional diguanylate cyclase/phosphodiesterase [Clostridia bacterium]|nr:bifunctional diguanylate cyclase/phosphodiesterase [Clostridia bacterium]
MNYINERLKFIHEDNVFNIMKKRCLSACKINVSRDIVEELIADELPEEYVSNISTFSQTNYYLQQEILSDEERVKFEQVSRKEYHMEQYYIGITVTEQSYRIKRPDGKVSWVTRIVNIVPNIEKDEMYFFGYVEETDNRKKRELSLPEKIEYDEYTGLYEQKTATKLINLYLTNERSENKLSAYFTINIVDYDTLISKHGDMKIHKILPELANVINLYWLNSGICSYCGNGRFYVFLTETESREALLNGMQEFLSLLDTCYFTFLKNYKFEFLINIVFPELSDDTFLKIDEKEKYVARSTKGSEREQCVVFKNSAIEYANNYQESLNRLKTIPGTANDVAYTILSSTVALVSGETLNIALHSVLSMLSDFYGAKGSRLFEYDKDFSSCNGFWSWSAEYVEQLKEYKSDQTIYTLDSLKEIYHSHKTIMINDVSIFFTDENELKNMEQYKIDSVYIAPFELVGKLTGLIIVENPTRNLGDLLFLSAAAYFIPGEIAKRRMQNQEQFSLYHDLLTELENRASYQKYVDDVHEGMFSTLGVIIIDINGLKEINNRFGSKYGDNFVKDVANVLRKNFEGCKIYRFSGGTFCVLCADITLDSFEDKVSYFKKEFGGKEEISVSVGHGWASSDIDIEKMIAHAEDMMLIAKQEYYRSDEEISKYFKYKLRHQLRKSIEDGEFMVYLQPKADINTSKVNGAEALIRRIHPQNGIISPGKFVPMLEKENLIRYIDFFVFEEVLKTMQRWKQEGKRLFPISLNFSRATLLEPGIINSMNEIHEKYQISKELIEIEITETLGDMERATIESIGGRIVKSGYRLSLDDFGASFSNLSILNTMQFDVLKLDKSIINNIVSAEKSRIIIRKVLELCNELGIESIAEGVETEEQLKMLQEMGCKQAQGYYFNKPIPIKDFEEKYL